MSVVEANEDYYVQRTLKNGKVINARYFNYESFEYNIDKWVSEGQKVLVLNGKHSFSADYIYKLQVKKIWGNKEDVVK